jgi:methionyl-tRNA formyltransferase
MVVIAFGQKIAPHVVDHARLGAVNLHASLLPKYRGAAPINWAIINGEKVTGNSVIRLAQKMDSGAVLGQSEPPLTMGELETAGEVHDRLAEDGPRIVMRVLDELARGMAKEVEQDESAATLAPKLSRAASRIDWEKAAVAIANQIRGMYPWPGCRVRVADPEGVEIGRVTLVRARPVGADLNSAGLIDDGGQVSCGDGSLEIVELQPEGKRPMRLEEYRNGHRWEKGMRLESITS